MYIIAITGASGSIYGVRLIEEMLKRNKQVCSVVSDAGWKTLNFELFENKKAFRSMHDVLAHRDKNTQSGLLTQHNNDDLFSKPASGSSRFDAVIIIPCSMKSVSAIASSYADSLITRTADVALKEKRTCIVVPRETPLHTIHLENMQKIASAGGIILPPVPGFYSFPQSVDDIVNFTIGKILNILEFEHDLFPAWGDKLPGVH